MRRVVIWWKRREIIGQIKQAGTEMTLSIVSGDRTRCARLAQVIRELWEEYDALR
jgi:hypothetical protein